MKIPYAAKSFDEKEKEALLKVIEDNYLTHSKFCNRFENKLASFQNMNHALMVNSGSSANLLAFMTLTQPDLKERQIKRGDEVITTACCFPTTLSPIVQFGAIPVFVDITIPEYNVDITQLEKALSSKTKAVILAHTLGNPFNIKAVKEFCDKHKLWLISDCCDAIGSKYNNSKVGKEADICTFSFYPAHHLVTGEGGACCTDNKQLNDIMLSLRDWGRQCTCMSGVDNVCGNRFSGEYDHKYVYSRLGYNLKATEFQGALGCIQIDKVLDSMIIRKNNFDIIKKCLKLLDIKELILPEFLETSNPFGFLVTLKSGNRNNFAEYLESKGIQTRPLFAGNILRQPCMNWVECSLCDLKNTDNVYYNTLWFATHQNLTCEEIEYIVKTIKSYFS